jgi:hypothetical protein
MLEVLTDDIIYSIVLLRCYSTGVMLGYDARRDGRLYVILDDKRNRPSVNNIDINVKIKI